MTDASRVSRRLIIVSNRLPFTVLEEDGKLEFKGSSGGLVSGLSSFLRSWPGEYVWVGWPGFNPSGENREELKKRALEEYRAYPVLIEPELMEQFYHGFCNNTIWPLFHYFPTLARYDEEQWNIYKQVNEIFRQSVLEIAGPDDIVWVHDYHLLVLPGLLRESLPRLAMGFFLHIPFPSFEIFQLIPRAWGREILEGMLGADLVGFHIHEYTQYFLRNVLRIIGYEHNLGRVTLPARTVKADTFPMGIEYDKFHNVLERDDVRRERQELKKTLADFKALFSIDRLDYTKGIINRLEGYYLFLQNNPEWHGRIIFILIVVPSRIGVEHYQQMKNNIDSMVGKINGEFGNITWTPIIYQFRSVEFPILSALYSLCDIALITPLRDGMNLVAKEYVASRTDGKGVLILSAMAGAAKELGEAIVINPNHKEDIARALKEAAEMSPEEQSGRMERMQRRLKTYDIDRWAGDFLSSLDEIKDEQKRYEARILGGVGVQNLKESFRKSSRRLIFLDYDGTLVPFVRYPQEAVPDDELCRLLHDLSRDEATELVLISGRDKAVLTKWFGGLSINLVAEHGAWIRQRGSEWRQVKPLSSEWKSSLYPILETYADRLPGAFIEEKEYSLVWHYRQADPEHASLVAQELLDHINDFTANIDLQTLWGSKVIEIRNSGVNKGAAAMAFLSGHSYDFILALGDDWTDEDLFRAMPEEAISIKVGLSQTYARFNINDYKSSRMILREVIS